MEERHADTKPDCMPNDFKAVSRLEMAWSV